ncbi:hypothetical protein BH11VER1_BH11VER1_14030 [soil metagenome]
MKLSILPMIAAGLLATGLTLTEAGASERRFSYSYETTTAPVGSWEYEQWMTWKHYSNKDRFDFRHELEYGISDKLQLGIYLADWRYESGDDVDSKADYKSSAIELIYQLTDPNKSAFGSALYGEVAVGDEEFVLEAKFLLQKNIGPLVLVYNAVLEAEWEGDSLDNLNESKAVLENTFGASYQINPSFFVGVEAVHEIEFAEWSDAGDHVVFVGPNFSFRKGDFFTTVAGLFQVTDVDGEPESQIRVLAGINF